MLQEKMIRIVAIMTTGRYGSHYAMGQITSALQKCGIPLASSIGAYYGQCMQRMMCDVIASGTDYILTVDSDSIFTDQHIKRLLDWIVRRDDIDAVCGVQAKRGSGIILGTRGKHEEVEWTGEPIQLKSAHFGLTIIDAKKLEQTPLPWFANQADSNGQWVGEDKIDDDVWFWKQWEKAGNTIFTDPGCRIGHLQEMISVLDDQMQLRHLYGNQWSEYCGTTLS